MDNLDDLGIENIEDICASLGLGEVPMLNEENRKLNRQLQELQVSYNIYIQTK